MNTHFSFLLSNAAQPVGRRMTGRVACFVLVACFVCGAWGLPVAQGQDETPEPDESKSAVPADPAQAPAPDQTEPEQTDPADGEATGEESTGEEAADDWQSLLQQWHTLEQEMIEFQDKMVAEENSGEARKMRTTYVEMNDQAMALIDRLETAAVAELKAGNLDQNLLETLTGLLMNHASFDRDIDALDLGQLMIDAGVDAEYFDKAAAAERMPPQAREILRELTIRLAESAADDLPRVKLTTSKGDIVLELFENEAPDTVGNFVSLVEDGFYDGLNFHRVIENFMAQGGDPNGDGTGGPGYNIFCECYKSDYRRHFTGSLSMAKQVPRDTGGSQFFITFVRTSNLDGKHTVFGRVIEGMDVVNQLQRINPQEADGPQPDRIISGEVIRKREHEYQPVKVGE